MADLGAEAAGGPTAPPAPNQKSDTAVGDATTPPPLQTDTADPGTPRSTPAPPPQNQTEGAETADQPQPHQPPIQTEASGASCPPTQRQTGTGEGAGTSQLSRTPSQEKTVAAGAENHLPAPPPQEQDDTVAKDGNESKDSAMENPRQAEEQKPGPSRWPRVRSPVLFLLSLFRLRLGKQGQKITHAKISPPSTEEGGAGDVPHKPATEKEESEGSSNRNEAEASMSASGQKEAPSMKPHQTRHRKSLQRTESVLPPEGDAGSKADANRSPMKRKLQNACRLVKNTMSWYRPHRSPENVENLKEEAAAEKVELVHTKPSTSPPEEEKTKPNPRWEKWGEERLEGILEDACTRLVVAEFGNSLDDKKQECLLTFSVFPLGSKVKKEAVTYWWSTRFPLPETAVGKADEIFSKLSGGGFLEPIKNRCGVIHGCRVNPLVHWMVKRMARERDLADLDDIGNPAEVQPKSEILCLTPGNRDQMQKLRDDEDSGTAKPSLTKVPPGGAVDAGAPSQDQKDKNRLDAEMLADKSTILFIYGKKKVVLNISAHVYRLPKPLLVKLADQLKVLQLGRWGNSDDETYMEVEALEFLAIGKLKNLRYLSLRGLSRLKELPMEVKRLRRLAILDARGCQNLVSVPSDTVQKLKGLTHLDLTECYMLEHIGRGVSALSELRVFKGFIFGVGKRRRDACRLKHLAKLKKLRKLNVNVTTDANVDKGKMAELRNLAGLVSLTVTWGERPSVLLDDESKKKKLEDLLERWTSLVLPRELEKLDVRCYPQPELPVKRWLNGQRNLKKLYVRGGEVEKLDIPTDNQIETVRLRYLNKFRLNWTNELLPKLNMNRIKYVEVVDKDLKVMRNQTKGKGDDKVKDEHKEKKKVKEEQELIPIMKRMEIPESTIDENGVWVKDPKEEEAAGTTTPQHAPKAEAATDAAGKIEKGDDGTEQTDVKGEQSSLKVKGTEGENEQPAEDKGNTSERKEVDGGDKYHEAVKEEKYHVHKGNTSERKEVDGGDKYHEAVKEEKYHVPSDKENHVIRKDAKKHESTIDENKMQERHEKEQKEDMEKRESPTDVVDQTVAPGSRAIIDQTDTDKISENKEERQDGTGSSRGPDEPPIKEDQGDASEIRKFDGSNADEPREEGEDEGREGDSKVFDMVHATDTESKIDKGDDDTEQTDVKGEQSSLKVKGTEENEQPEEDKGNTSERKEVDGGDKYHEVVKEEKDHMKKAVDEENHVIMKDV